MIRPRIYPTAELPAPLQSQILTFLRLTWPKGFFDENEKRDWLAHQENHPLHFVLVEEGLLISHGAVVWKYLDHGGETYKAYGLSGVFTHPSFRQRGYGRQIVEVATTYIKSREADIGMLWCASTLKGFYARWGWVEMEKAKTLIGPKEAPFVYNLLLMMLFLSEKGRHSQASFEAEPIYFGVEAW